MVTKPIAGDDTFNFAYGDTLSGNLLDNDTPGANGKIFLRNFDGDTVLAKKAGQVTEVAGDFGTFFVKADGSFTYQLNSEYSNGLSNGQTLTEKFSYKVSDGSGNTDYALATVNITSKTPLAVDDFFTGTEGQTISGNVLENDIAGFNGKLFLRSVENTGIDAKKGLDQVTSVDGDHGTFFFKPDGSFTYELDASEAAGLNAGEQFTEKLQYYKISDGSGHTDVGIINLTINGVDDAIGDARLTA